MQAFWPRQPGLGLSPGGGPQFVLGGAAAGQFPFRKDQSRLEDCSRCSAVSCVVGWTNIDVWPNLGSVLEFVSLAMILDYNFLAFAIRVRVLAGCLRFAVFNDLLSILVG